MRQLEDWSDERQRGPCIYCGEDVPAGETTKDHVPTKALLKRPYPQNLPVVPVHLECNRRFALDEEYLACFLASVISGSTDVDTSLFPKQSRALQRNSLLRKRIDRCRTVQFSLDGGQVILWKPERERVEQVIVKNARGHALFDVGQALPWSPRHVSITPLSSLSEEQRQSFEAPQEPMLWPEVGSRLFQRFVLGEIDPGGWIPVQQGVYRYAIEGIDRIRVVIYEYLAAEVAWDSF